MNVDCVQAVSRTALPQLVCSCTGSGGEWSGLCCGREDGREACPVTSTT